MLTEDFTGEETCKLGLKGWSGIRQQRDIFWKELLNDMSNLIVFKYIFS